MEDTVAQPEHTPYLRQRTVPSSELLAALAEAQNEFPDIPRSKTVKVKAKSGAQYTFSYAPYEAIVKAVRPILAKHGLCFYHQLEGSMLYTVLGHKDGSRLESLVTVPPFRDNQELGSNITYLKRYQLSGILGLATEEDDDSNRAIGNEFEEKKPKRKSETKPKANKDGEALISEGQIKMLRSQMGDKKEELEKGLCEEYGIKDLSELPFGEINEALEWVKAWR